MTKIADSEEVTYALTIRILGKIYRLISPIQYQQATPNRLDHQIGLLPVHLLGRVNLCSLSALHSAVSSILRCKSLYYPTTFVTCMIITIKHPYLQPFRTFIGLSYGHCSSYKNPRILQ
ncbi:hypothetical protein M422DRAFT_29285, partial [Sphaerobolus stellatus SS14]